MLVQNLPGQQLRKCLWSNHDEHTHTHTHTHSCSRFSPSWSLAPLLRHAQRLPPGPGGCCPRKGAGGVGREACGLPCWALVPLCQRNTAWLFEEKSVSVWSERDYLVNTSSCAGARIGACTCISKLKNQCVCVCVCVFLCTPAMFQLSFILLCWELLSLSRRVLTCRGRLKEMALKLS